MDRVAMVRENKFWKMKTFLGQGNVREFHFQSENLEKMIKSQGI